MQRRDFMKATGAMAGIAASTTGTVSAHDGHSTTDVSHEDGGNDGASYSYYTNVTQW